MNPRPDRDPAPPVPVAARAPGEVVRASLAALTSRDLDAMLATFGPDPLVVTGSTVVPPDEVAEFFGWAMREIDPVVTITRLVESGGTVACEFEFAILMGGRRQCLNRAAFYTVTDGLIRSVKVYDERD